MSKMTPEDMERMRTAGAGSAGAGIPRGVDVAGMQVWRRGDLGGMLVGGRRIHSRNVGRKEET